jgi:hypothetical protein
MPFPWYRQRVPLWKLDLEARLLQVVRERGPIAKSKIVGIVAGSYGQGFGPQNLPDIIRARPKVEAAFARLAAAGALLGKAQGQFTRYVSGLVVAS